MKQIFNYFQRIDNRVLGILLFDQSFLIGNGIQIVGKCREKLIVEIFKSMERIILLLAEECQSFQGSEIGTLGAGYFFFTTTILTLQIIIYLLMHDSLGM